MARLVTFLLPLISVVLIVFYGQTSYSVFHFMALLGAVPYILISQEKTVEFRPTYINNLGFYISVSSILLFVFLNMIYLESLFLRTNKLSGSGFLFYAFIIFVPFIHINNASSVKNFVRPLLIGILLFFLGGRINFMIFFLAVLNVLCRFSFLKLMFFGLIIFVSMFSMYWLRDSVFTLDIFELKSLQSLISDRGKFYSVDLPKFNQNFLFHFLYPIFSFILEGEVIKYSLAINKMYFYSDHGVHLGVPFGLYASSHLSLLHSFLGSVGYLLLFWVWYLFVRRYISPFGLSFITISFMLGFSISVFKLKYTFISMIFFSLYVTFRKLMANAKD